MLDEARILADDVQLTLLWFLLLWMSWQDIRTGYLSAEGLTLLALLSAIYGMVSGGHSLWGLTALLPSGLLLLISLGSREAIGRGDAYLVWALGFHLQPLLVCRILWDSFTLAAIGGGFFFLKARILPGHGDGRGEEIRLPFLPFVAMALGWMTLRGWFLQISGG